MYYAVKCKLIKKSNILKQYKASATLDVPNFEILWKNQKDVYNLFDNAKYAIKTLIEIFGHNYKSKTIHHFTQDDRLVLSELGKVNKEIYQPKPWGYSGGIRRYDTKK